MRPIIQKESKFIQYRERKNMKDFGFLGVGFHASKKRKHISLRAITKNAQEIPANALDRIQSFHQFIRYHANLNSDLGILAPSPGVGKYRLGNIANMDQIPLEFESLTGGTYEAIGTTTVQVCSQASGLDKRQATIQATIFRRWC